MNVTMCIVQARMGSTRFPGKVLADINGETVLDRLFTQLSYSKNIKKNILATSSNSEDDILEKWATKRGINCFRGNLSDVLDRYYQAAKYYSADVIVRVTADCPLIDPGIIDAMIKEFNLNSLDYLSNNKPLIYPQGYEAEVLTFKVLESAWHFADLASEREHVTPYIWKNPGLFKVKNFNDGSLYKSYDKYRLTLDYKSDLKVITDVYNKVKRDKGFIKLNDVINVINQNEDLFEENKEITKNEGYEKSILNDKRIPNKGK